AGIIDAEAIGCDVVPGGEWLTAHAPSRAAALRQAADELRSFGLPATLTDREEMRARGIAGAEIHAGLHLGIGFGLHPLRYVRGLAAAAARHGAALHGGSPVLAWDRQGGDHVLRTPGGEVRSRRVIVATNADTPEALAAGLAGRVLPALSNIIVTRPLAPAEQRAQGYVATDLAYDSRHLLHYYRLLPDGRFLLGARSSTREGPIAAARMRAAMRRRLGRLFPAWADVETPHFWRGRIALAADRLPHVAPLAGVDGAFLGMAFHGSGIAMGSWAGRALAGLAAGRIVAGDLPAPLAQPLPAFAFPILRPWYLRAAYGWYALRDEWL
ncbi:MAG: FAD-binding oxidoreductase, partial [Alphaproteobacteria bacterium]|nr:FAD-binding oxidoreductase [Alphaproteobacteria bacterium]